MIDRRRKDQNWFVADSGGKMFLGAIDGKVLAVLMDLRDELKALNMKLRTISKKLPPRRSRKG